MDIRRHERHPYCMVMARIELLDRTSDSPRHLTVRLHPGYGASAETAHVLLSIAMGAEWPLVMDSAGDLLHVPREMLLGFATWEVRDGDGCAHI